jgi:hypothetical protein
VLAHNDDDKHNYNNDDHVNDDHHACDDHDLIDTAGIHNDLIDTAGIHNDHGRNDDDRCGSCNNNYDDRCGSCNNNYDDCSRGYGRIGDNDNHRDDVATSDQGSVWQANRDKAQRV